MKLLSYRIALTAVGVLALSAAATACGDDDDDTSSDTGGPAATAAPAATDAPAATGAPAVSNTTVMTAESDLGTILVDGEGVTLYLFMPDGQGASTCTADCLAAWPSLTGPAAAGEGVDASLLGTATRPDDGSEQATYNGWPLYHFANDTAPGDINGQGVSDVWFVVDPSGEPIGATVNLTSGMGY